jgi:hypothetical protein
MAPQAMPCRCIRAGTAAGGALCQSEGARRRQPAVVPAVDRRQPGTDLGGINLYSTGVDALDEQGRTLGLLLSTLAAVVVDASRREAQLHVALESRAVIGEAVGILRSQSNISGQDAFAMLVHASQRMNVKLREVARDIIEHPARR